MTTITIDLGGSRVKAGVVENGKVIEKHTEPARAEEGLARLLPRLEPVLEDWRDRFRAQGLGMALPCLADPVRKTVIGSCGKYADAGRIDFQGWAREKLGLPTILENDANAAAIGEHAFGAAKGCDDFILMILGTGIGTSAVTEGRLIRGKHNQAGVLMGHIPLKAHGRKCAACGVGVGCAEAQASTWALEKIVAESDADSLLKAEGKVDFETLRRCYDRGDPLARSIYAECCEYWSNLLISMICAYDPELIVLSGGVLKWGEELIEDLKEQVCARSLTPWGEPRFAAAADPDASVLLGLHELFRQSVGD